MIFVSSSSSSSSSSLLLLISWRASKTAAALFVTTTRYKQQRNMVKTIVAMAKQAQRDSSTTESTHNNKKIHNTSIHWFRNGLRFHDNPVLKKACDESHYMIPLYIIDPDLPFVQTSTIKPGCIRSNFILESLKNMDYKLRNNMELIIPDNIESDSNSNDIDNVYRSQLIVILGKAEIVLPKVIRAVNANALYYEQDVAEPIRIHDQQVIKSIRKDYNDEQFKILSMSTHTIHPMEVYLAKLAPNHVAPSTYGGFTKIFQQLKVPNEVDDIVSIPPLPYNIYNKLDTEFGIITNQDDNDTNKYTIPSLEQLGYNSTDQLVLKTRHKGGIDLIGGEDAALKLLKRMMSRTEWVATFEKPKTSPNALMVDTTGLSPYMKHGCLSSRRFYNELSKVYNRYGDKKKLSKPPVSLHGQLMWREYNYLMGYTTPNFDKMVNNPIARQIPWDDGPHLLSAWEHSKTGYPFIDAIMTQLRETGWIHHLARHAVACFLTRGDLWLSWENGTKVFEKYLIDADWSINNFNWQWLSCTAHFYQYFRCYSPVSFGKKTDPNGDYIRKWLPIFRDFPKKYIYEPWDAPIDVQRKYKIIIGENYPYPIVEHSVIVKANMNRMKLAYDAHKISEQQQEQLPPPPAAAAIRQTIPKRNNALSSSVKTTEIEDPYKKTRR